MPGEQIPPSSAHSSQTGLHLLPFGVVIGATAPVHDDRLIGAQSALNRIQVWLGDVFIELRRRRRPQSAAVSLAERSH